MAMTMAQAAAQPQQEVFTLKAQVAAESELADAVRGIRNLANAESQKDSLGRPKEFSGKELEFQQWSKKNVGVLLWSGQGV